MQSDTIKDILYCNFIASVNVYCVFYIYTLITLDLSQTIPISLRNYIKPRSPRNINTHNLELLKVKANGFHMLTVIKILLSPILLKFLEENSVYFVIKLQHLSTLNVSFSPCLPSIFFHANI